MANETMTLISTVTVGSGGASGISLSSIPQTYTDLVLVTSTRALNGTTRQDVTITVNGSSSGTGRRILYGTGSSVAAYGDSAGPIYAQAAGSTTANTFDNSQTYIPNYAGSQNKVFGTDFVSENNATSADQVIEAGKWTTTSAITSIDLSPNLGNFVQYSTVSLYGVLKGSGGATVS